MTLTEQIKSMVIESNLSLYRIAKDSEIPYPQLYRFATGDRGMNLATAEKLCSYFSVRLTKPRSYPK
ncbi:MAG: helix-turn-helix transcriptional regulator [Planctomycetia bacterium]|nr:helix-turn-helix transcriptional regulator [Planctomycetia bacterium]